MLDKSNQTNMEPENPTSNQINNNPTGQELRPVAPIPVPSPVPEVVEPKVVQGNKLKAFWDGFSPRNKKLVKVVGIVFAVIIFLLLISSLLTKKVSQPKTQATAKPTPGGVYVNPAPEVIISPSRYATDSGILAIEGDLKKTESDLNASEINDIKLTPPNLYFDINFEK